MPLRKRIYPQCMRLLYVNICPHERASTSLLLKSSLSYLLFIIYQHYHYHYLSFIIITIIIIVLYLRDEILKTQMAHLRLHISARSHKA